VVLAVFAVLGVIGVFRWLWPVEPTTTVTKSTPENPAVTTSIPVTTTPSTTWTMTIYRPEHGTVFVEGTSITCGSRGDKCAAELEDGFPVVLRQEPDATYQFLRYTGQCGDNGEVNMTKPLACSATFQKAVAANDKPAPAAPLPPGPPRPLNPGGTRGTPAPPTAAQDHGNAAPGGSPDKSPKPDIEPPPPPPSGGPPVVAGGTAAPLRAAEEYAKDDITLLVKNYCSAIESRKPALMKKIYPLAPERKLKEQYGDYDWIKCAPGPLQDFDPAAAVRNNVEQIQFVMKQKLKAKSGGAPKDAEFDVTMTVSRRNANSDWLIDRADVVPKPKD